MATPTVFATILFLGHPFMKSGCRFPNNRRPLVRAPQPLDTVVVRLLDQGQCTRPLIDSAAGRA
jgi:hypothetical protein